METMLENKDTIPEYCSKRTVILGCGNILLGDDGFGPEVINYFEANNTIPEDVTLLDAGTGVIDILFNIALSEVKPRQIILIDTLGRGLPPGTISALTLESIQKRELRTFSQHQIPTSKILRELQELGGVEINIIAVEPEHIPEEIQPGLSEKVKEAVLQACDIIAAALNKRLAEKLTPELNPGG